MVGERCYPASMKPQWLTFCLVFCWMFSFSLNAFPSNWPAQESTVSPSLVTGFSLPSNFFSRIICFTICAQRGRVFRILIRDNVETSLDIAGWSSVNKNWHLSKTGEHTSSYERDDSCRACKGDRGTTLFRTHLLWIQNGKIISIKPVGKHFFLFISLEPTLGVLWKYYFRQLL